MSDWEERRGSQEGEEGRFGGATKEEGDGYEARKKVI